MELREELAVKKIPYQMMDLRERNTEPGDPVEESPHALVRTLLLRTPRGYVAALVPALSRIDLGAAARALRVERVAVATPDELQWILQDEHASEMSPFGSSRGLLTLIDALLRAGDHLVFEKAGAHEGIGVKFEDFEAMEHPIIARFTHPYGPVAHSWFPEDRMT